MENHHVQWVNSLFQWQFSILSEGRKPPFFTLHASILEIPRVGRLPSLSANAEDLEG
jgi:hypothetical protein